MADKRADERKGQVQFSTTKTNEETVLRIAGQLDAVTAPDLRSLIDALLVERHQRVIVDASDLRVIDSCGVGGLIFLYKEVKKYGGVVTIRGLSNQPRVVLELLQLERVFQA